MSRATTNTAKTNTAPTYIVPRPDQTGRGLNIVCVGGGPAGLYFAICAKRRNPQHNLTVIERRPEGVTFGWGFGFWDDALNRLYRSDPVTAKQIEDAAGVWGGVEVHIADRPTAYLGGYGLSMGRQRLLDILVTRARELGITLQFERKVTDLAELADADLIVASDGINSELRTADAEHFGTTVEMGRNYFLWLGTHKVFNQFQWIFENTSAGWIWLHCYYLDEGRSTCIVECPPETWKGLGFDLLGPQECLKTLEKIFARHLDNYSLISQIQEVDKVTWLNGKQIRNATWVKDNIALVGDAAHTTHFSIGSGTRLAIGDAVVLAEKVAEHGENVATALRAYDAERRPAIDEVQREALNSMHWLEDAPQRLDNSDPVQFAYDLSRRLGTREAWWRYYLHLATDVPALRVVRNKLTAARRTYQARQRVKPLREVEALS